MVLRYYLKQLLVVGVLVWGVYFLLSPYREYVKTRSELQDIDRTILERQEAVEGLRRDVYRLRTDTRALERVAREKFGYCRPQETIYDFTDSTQSLRTGDG